MNLITESGTDLIVGFLVLYTYLISDSVIRGEAKKKSFIFMDIKCVH